jgi:hypothetical protein
MARVRWARTMNGSCSKTGGLGVVAYLIPPTTRASPGMSTPSASA